MARSERSKFIIAVICVVAALLLLDFGFGAAVEYARRNSRGGDTRNNYYILNELRDSVLVMGSSRANHHYVTDSLAKGLHTTAYNCGTDGNGILLAYAFLSNMLERGERPALIIYDIFPLFDLYDNSNRTNCLTHLRPAYDAPGISGVIADIDFDELLKNRLAAYRFNSVFIQNFADAVSPKQLSQRGYKPLFGTITTDFRETERTDIPFDTLKIKYFEKFLTLCEGAGVRLLFVVSPTFHKTRPAQEVRRFLDIHSIKGEGGRYRYLDFSCHPSFAGHRELFADPSHLNDTGARLFTRMLLDSIAG